MRPSGRFRTGHGRNDVAEVEFERVGEDELGAVAVAPHALRLGVGFDECDALLFTAGHGEVVDGFAVDREEAAGRTVFRTHVADGGAVGERHVVEARAEEFDELRDNALLAQHLHDHQHEVGRGDAFLELAGELESDDLGQKHRDRLAEHRGFRLDTANAPAENAETVDHGGVAVGADTGVRVGGDFAVFFTGPDRLAQIFQIDLVTDAGAGRNDAEVLECLLAPLQEAVALAVALVFQFDVAGKSVRRAEFVDDDRVVDDEVDGNERVDLLRIAAERDHGITHRGEVDDGGNAGEVLHQHAGRTVGDFVFSRALVVEPGGNVLDVLLGDGTAIFVAQQVLEQNLHRVGKLGYAGETIRLSLGQAVIDVVHTVDGERGATIEAV